MAEPFSDVELRMTALTVAHETAAPGQTIGGTLYAAEAVYRFLTGGTVVNVDGQIRVVSSSALTTRH